MLYRFSLSILVFGMLMGVAPTDAAPSEAEWQQLINGTSIGQIWALDSSADHIYAGSSEGVFRSENNGQTWVRIGFDTQDPFDNSVAALTVNRNSVYVGTWSSGIFRSDDAGETWKRINDGLWNQRSDETVYYGTARGFLIIDDTLINVMYHAGTYTSTNRGETWINVSEKWEQGDSIYNMTFFDGYLWSAISHVWMARSADKGKTGNARRSLNAASRVTGRFSRGSSTLPLTKASDVGMKQHRCGISHGWTSYRFSLGSK